LMEAALVERREPTVFMESNNNTDKTYFNATDFDKDNCDTDTINDIKEHTFADNQTMIHLAYAYLNARGIH